MTLRRILAAIVLILLIASGIIIYLMWPFSAFGQETFVDIPRGTGTRAMARMLADAGVIRSQWAFLVLRALRPRDTLKAGEYRFDKPATAWEVYGRIARGDVFLLSLVVPEGQNVFDIADHLEKSNMMRRERLLAAARDTSLIRDLAPRAPSLEGYLFPDTYRFPRKTAPEQLVRIMTDRFRKAWAELGSPAPDVHRIVTLASLVETEARVPEERPIVASVFANRLKVGMPLQADPTTVYAARLQNRFRGTIYASDLDNSHPYNTYRNPGLPPGPVANPGMDSLKAALHPADTKYLYFVAKGDGSGGHHFSTDLADHALAVQKYRRAVNAERNGEAGSTPSLAPRTASGAGRVGRPARTQGAARTR